MNKYNILISLLILILIFILFPAKADSRNYVLTIPAPLNDLNGRNLYVEQLLNKIFAAQGIELQLDYNNNPPNKARSMRMLAQGKNLDLFWATSTIEKEAEFLVIKIPIYNGYIGWRALLIQSKNAEKFENIHSLAQLSQLLAVQKHDWPDYKIFKHNGLAVASDMTFTGMFKAIETGIADYFPRSVLEIERELKVFGHDKLMIAPHILLRYRAASYFFVNKENVELAALIEAGFKKIVADGSFDEHFASFFGETIRNLNLAERTIIFLENPYFEEK